MLATDVLISFEFRVSGFGFRVRFNSKLETLNSRLSQRVWFISSQRKILSQCVSLPIIWQENAAQIGMSVKNDAKQIVGFALVPIRRPPDSCDSRHMRVFFVQQD